MAGLTVPNMQSTNISQNTAIVTLCGWVAILLLDIVVSFGLYHLYKSKKNNLALFTTFSRLVYCIFLIVGISFLVEAVEADADTIALFNSFEEWWSMGLIVFGFHLIGLAKLICDKHLSRIILGGLLMLGGWGYILIHGAPFISDGLLKQTDLLENIFLFPMIAGELGFAIWLSILGFRKSASL